eukprot:SAG22_NODE_1989_length_3201_cov_1.728240_3_plen_200_part_00
MYSKEGSWSCPSMAPQWHLNGDFFSIQRRLLAGRIVCAHSLRSKSSRGLPAAAHRPAPHARDDNLLCSSMRVRVCVPEADGSLVLAGEVPHRHNRPAAGRKHFDGGAVDQDPQRHGLIATSVLCESSGTARKGRETQGKAVIIAFKREDRCRTISLPSTGTTWKGTVLDRKAVEAQQKDSALQLTCPAPRTGRTSPPCG